MWGCGDHLQKGPEDGIGGHQFAYTTLGARPGSLDNRVTVCTQIYGLCTRYVLYAFSGFWVRGLGFRLICVRPRDIRIRWQDGDQYWCDDCGCTALPAESALTGLAVRPEGLWDSERR